MNTSNKSTKTIIPHNNVVLEKKQIKHTNISSTNVSNTKKTTKIPKVQQNRGNHFINISSSFLSKCIFCKFFQTLQKSIFVLSAKLFKSREINKKKQMLIPQLILTPASPENRD